MTDMDKQNTAMQSFPDSRSSVETLLGRFLDGTTTVEEEQRLARYFREARDLPEEWQAYRDMFAYFDDGMPLGGQPEFEGVRQAAAVKPRRWRVHALLGLVSVAAAAAVALLLVMRPGADVTRPGAPVSRPVYAQQEEQSADTLQAPQPSTGSKGKPAAGGSRKPGNGSRVVRRHYDIAPPKRYYADAVRNDSAAAGSTQKLVAQQRAIADEQQQFQEAIKETQRLVEEARSNLVASGNYADEEY